MPRSDLFAGVIEEALTGGAVVRFRAEGISMYPTIRDGEEVTIASVAAGDIVRGDVLLCRHSGRLLAHRVVAVAKGQREDDRVFQLRGDAKRACDAPVGPADVIGRVTAVHRHGRAIAVCGRSARLRHHVRVMASRAKAFVRAKSGNLMWSPHAQ